MKINYHKYLKKNLINVFKDVLLDVKQNGLKEGHHIYISFLTKNPGVKISKLLKHKFPKEMTIIIQYEYWNLLVENDLFEISLSFNDIKENLIIPFNSVISFADPYADFGLKLIQNDNFKNEESINNLDNKNKKFKNNVIDFKNFKKN